MEKHIAGYELRRFDERMETDLAAIQMLMMGEPSPEEMEVLEIQEAWLIAKIEGEK